MTDYSKFKVFDGRADLENDSVTGRMYSIYDALDRAEKNVEKLENAIDRYKDDEDHSSLRTQAYAFSEELLKNIELVESEFPDTIRDSDYSRLHNAINHMYWRLDDGKWTEEDSSKYIIRELKKISSKKEIIYEIRYVIRESFGQEYFRPPIDDFNSDFKQAKDLLALEQYDTALFVMCRACEKAEWVLGKERNIETLAVNGGNELTWNDEHLPSWARNQALYCVDFPDGEGKMIDKSTKDKFQRLFGDLRNDVAHLSQGKYDRDRSVREFQNLKELLMTLSKRIADIRDYTGEINEITDQTVNPPN